MKEDYQNVLEKLTLFFLSNPVLFNVQDYEKQKRCGTSDQFPFKLPKKFRKIPFLMVYYLTKFDDLIWSGFWHIPKITSANLWKPIHDINYCTFVCPFETGKWKGREKVAKNWISWKWKELFRWNKKCIS